MTIQRGTHYPEAMEGFREHTYYARRLNIEIQEYEGDLRTHEIPLHRIAWISTLDPLRSMKIRQMLGIEIRIVSASEIVPGTGQ